MRGYVDNDFVSALESKEEQGWPRESSGRIRICVQIPRTAKTLQLCGDYGRSRQSLTKVTTRMPLQRTLTEGGVIRSSALEAGCWSTTPYSANLLGGLFYR